MPMTLYSPSLTSKPRKAVNALYSSPSECGNMHLLAHLDLVALADAVGARHPLAHAVHGQDRGLVEGRAQEGAGGVRQVMLGRTESCPSGMPSFCRELRPTHSLSIIQVIIDSRNTFHDCG